ncbi:MAG: CotH kinase family protein, partial [Bacteroidaceae bacterium]|nr:CotH kinase family protein [Bacteroidaceae bacterium]
MPEETWQTLITKASDKAYYECAATINGERFDNVAIRTKGASSLDDVKMMKSDRFSFTMKLNKYEKGQNYHGLSKLLLNNNIWDATQMKDAIVYDMCRFLGLPAPLTNYAKIYVNGKFFGCYLLVEPVDKHFCHRNWPNEVSNIYKPYHNLAYTGGDIEDYAEIADYTKVKGGEASMQRTVAALKSVAEGKDIDEHVDIESVMKYMALQTIVVNYDCMTGPNVQNYYLHEANGKISLIPWDYNLAWGGYPEDEEMEGEDLLEQSETNRLPTDAGKRSKEETCRIINFPIDTPFFVDLSQRTFFMKLLTNETYKSRYYHYLTLLCKEYINGGELAKTLSTIKSEIGEIA